ncbi:adenosylcobinamide-GDP ribazoletransferase [Magnetospirillum sulfuroxidans]|uniref:Adenosylcobinamide-GDP ribazoletransferase n=1 Tax=Magnetospirillum sulfuroxidans TaxID=611300 RepID=A0ABS5IE86_9PROT|nr:adenosylcobinamide-GDP ribazoletransferase [Magnetospirillum sulfuroxidans]
MSQTNSSATGWRGLVADAHLALVFLTRLPLPESGPYQPGALARAMRLFPLAGAVIGLCGGAVFAAAALVLPPLLAALLALLTTLVLTGALHEDGLADTADGLGARGDRDHRLEVMRDSRSGAYGVLAIVFSIALRAAALAAAPSALAGLGACVAAAALSRAMIPAVMQILPPARTDGLGAGAGMPHAGIAASAGVLGCVIAAIGAGMAAPVAIIAAIAASAAMAWLARRWFGGFTGDILGATQQLAEIAILIALAGTWS